jgi:hypothetical protein
LDVKRTIPIPRAGREAVLEAHKLSNAEARLVVAGYYDAQEMRKRADMQIRHLGDKEMPKILQYTADANAIIENEVKKALLRYSEATPVGEWCLSDVGIGPVITAGLLAHLDITKAPTAGHFWSFAGLNPAMKWEKGEKRPYNAALKQVCYHMGECFKRTSGNDDSFYGRLYRERKELLVTRNDAGHNAERAKVFHTRSAEVKKTLATGKLPAGNLDRQACNFVAKIFLSHLHGVMFFDRFKTAPPKPFALSILGHAHEIVIPNANMFPGFAQVYYGAALRAAAE